MSAAHLHTANLCSLRWYQWVTDGGRKGIWPKLLPCASARKKVLPW